MGRILKVTIILIGGLLVYYYFFGTIDEKRQSQKVFDHVKGIGHSIGQVLVNEKEKISSGQYEEIFNRLGSALEAIRDHVDPDDAQSMKRLEELENRKKTLEQTPLQDESVDEEQLKQELEELLIQTRMFFKNSGSG
jgi:Sec-independent protein translocase protein TatA